MAKDIAITELFNAVKMNNLDRAKKVLVKAKKELQVANKIKVINTLGKIALKLIDEIITAVSNGDIKEAKGKYAEAEKGFHGHVRAHLERILKEIDDVTELPKDVQGQYKKKQEAHNTSFELPIRVKKPEAHNTSHKSQDRVKKPEAHNTSYKSLDRVKKPEAHNTSYKSSDRVDDIQHLNDKTNRAQLPKPQNERDYKEENDQVAGLRQSRLFENIYSKVKNERDYKEENDQVAGLRQSGPSENKDSKPQNERDYKEENDQVAGLRQSELSENKDSKPTETYNNNSSASENNDKLERSKLASFRMRQNNPDIDDLSDPNRPTKIAERFSELYDNEWTEAFEELRKKNKTESIAIEILLTVVTQAYKFCTDVAEKQIKYITKHWNAIFEFGPDKYKNVSPSSKSLNDSKDGESLIIQYRKKIASKALQKLKEDFTERKVRQILDKAHLPTRLQAFTWYAQKTVELTWWMCVQDPPIFLCPPTEDVVFDKNLYKAYRKTGTKPHFFVWPALRLHKEGVVLVKGVVMFE